MSCFPRAATSSMTDKHLPSTAFNLINQVDVEETERRLQAYARENAEQIDMQSSFEDRQAELVRLQDEEDRRQKAERAAEFAKQDALDKEERAQQERNIIQALEEGEGSAEKIVKKQRAVALKRSSARQALDPLPPNTSNSKPSLLSKYAGFNRANFAAGNIEKDPFEPEDPMADYDQNWYDYRDLFTLRDLSRPYVEQATEAALHDRKKLAGGMDVKRSVWERSVRSAVMGLWTPPVRA